MEEQEFKLRVTRPEQFEAIANAPEVTALAAGPARTLSMTADYIDTADRRLLKAGYAYRVRREGDHWVATVKADLGPADEGGLHRHQEWEAAVAGPEPDLAVFADPELSRALAGACGDRPLVTLFRVDMKRRQCLLDLGGGSRAEWAADRGRIVAGEREETVCEVELELKEGAIAPLGELITTLRRQYPLEPDTRTKFARGLALAGLTPPEA
ncbi:MAG TPA: CYTH domain-containing protein [Gammaproteobacteria bacterium]|nr:CYTH domain-containing protein [Gammaproteobacteria bacterium]